jgi:transcriptional regulator with XRE-family HTH domain
LNYTTEKARCQHLYLYFFQSDNNIKEREMSKEIKLVSLEEPDKSRYVVGEQIVLTEPAKEESYIFPEILTKLRGERDRPIVADELGMSRSTLEKYEKGERKPDIDRAYDIAKYYGVSLDYLVKGTSSFNDTVHEDTGLSDKAIDNLKKLNESVVVEDKKVLEIINLLLENPCLSTHSVSVFDYLVKCKEDKEAPKVLDLSMYGDGLRGRSLFYDFELFNKIEMFIDSLISDECKDGRLTEVNKKLEEKRNSSSYNNDVNYQHQAKIMKASAEFAGKTEKSESKLEDESV